MRETDALIETEVQREIRIPKYVDMTFQSTQILSRAGLF